MADAVFKESMIQFSNRFIWSLGPRPILFQFPKVRPHLSVNNGKAHLDEIDRFSHFRIGI